MSDAWLGGALGGAGTGASIGTAVAPGIGTLIGALLGGLGGGLAAGIGGSQNPYNMVGDPSQVTNVNPYTAQWMEGLSGRTQNLDNLLKALQTQQGGYQQQAQGFLGQIANQRPSYQYDPNAGFAQFLAQNPALQGVINQSVGDFGAQSQVDALQAQLMREAAAKLPGRAAGSGAYTAAMTGALAKPLIDLASQSQQLRANAATNLLGQLMGQTGQNELNRVNVDRQRFADTLSQLQMGYQGAMGLGEQSFNQQQLASNQLGQLLGYQAQASMPEWWQPTYQTNPNAISGQTAWGLGMQGAGTLADSLSNVDWASLLGSMAGGPSVGNQQAANAGFWGF